MQVAPPAFLPVPGSLGLYQQGHGLTVFLNSRGEATAYDPHGEQMWQVSLPLFSPTKSLAVNRCDFICFALHTHMLWCFDGHMRAAVLTHLCGKRFETWRTQCWLVCSMLKHLLCLSALHATGAVWVQHALGLAWPTSRSRSPFLQTAPTLEGMALRRGSIPNVLLAAGASSAAILSEHGRELDAISFPVRGLAGSPPPALTAARATLYIQGLAHKMSRACALHRNLSGHALQAKPVLPLQVTDFSGDQLQDIMLMTYDGLYGWAQVTHD